MENINPEVIEEAKVVSDTLNREEIILDEEIAKEEVAFVCDPAEETGCDSCQ